MPRIIGFIRDQYADLPIPLPPAQIQQATYIVTGANTGLGLECTKHLFRMGAAHIIMAVRSLKRGEAAIASIRSSVSRQDNGVLELWELDLGSADSVEAFAHKLNALERLDGLIANAGVSMLKFQVVEGVEYSLFVNVVTTMLLVLRAIPKLQESARKYGFQTNVVVVTSNTALEIELE